jgi:phosphoserine aminotransferase
MAKPTTKPSDPHFCSGPCAKIPGWEISLLSNALIGRSHRSKDGQAAIKYMLDKTKAILEIPNDHKIALIPGSATGAITAAMWNFLGEKETDILVWDVFGKRWANDVKSLNIAANVYEAPFGEMPDFSNVNPHNNLLFVWNATSTGASIDNFDWYIPGEGLTLCDATSSAFCVKLPWEKLDITCFSWQKGMGSEGGHGLIVLSPKAMAHLENYTPKWPIPYIFNLKNSLGIRTEIFDGVTINTPSMLCLEDYLQSLAWAERNGGLSFLINRTQQNYNIVKNWMERKTWASPLIKPEQYRSRANSCVQILRNGLSITEDEILKITQVLAGENVAFDIKGFKGTPANLRIWTGPTVEANNIQILLEWVDWAYHEYLQ